MSRIALIGDNSIPYISHLIDIWNSGDSAVLIDKSTPPYAVMEMIKAANVSKCVIDRKVLKKWDVGLLEEVCCDTYDSDLIRDAILPVTIYEKFRNNYSLSEAVVLYSSGTTGISKGVILSHYALQTNADAIAAYMELTAEDCFYLAKSLTHASTLTGELLVALKNNVKAIVAPLMVSPRYILRQISKHGVSVLCLNPTLLGLMSLEYSANNYRYDLSKLKKIYVSGSMLNERLCLLARETFSPIHVFNVYGLSEAAPRVTAQTQFFCKSNSVGRPIRGVQIRIVNENGEEVGVNRKGVIYVNSPSLYSGYISGCEKHSSAFPGWLNTGDIGYLDNNNELHITGRIDNVITLDSHKIYPEDIETAIINSTPVTECIVAKLQINGREVLGCLYAGGQINLQEMVFALRNKLITYEIPKYYIKVEQIPVNNNGKKMRSVAAKLLERELNID